MSASKVVLGALLLVLVGVRLALPRLVRARVNRALGTMQGYEGAVERVSLALWRGRLTLAGLRVRDKKGDLDLRIPAFTADVGWGALLKGRLVASAVVEKPSLTMVTPKPDEAARKAKEKARKAEAEAERKTGKSLRRLLAELMPFRIERFSIEDGTVLVREGTADKKDEKEERGAEEKREQGPGGARFSRISLRVNGLANRKDAPGGATARAVAAARVMDAGLVALSVAFDPTAEEPAFELALEVSKVDLPALNPIFRWQWGVDVKKGSFDLLAEAKASGGAFKGYLKPFLRDIEMGRVGEDKGPLKKAKEKIVQVAAKALENERTGSVATRVPFEGRFGRAHAGVWEAVVEVLRNAFVRALEPEFEKI